MVLPDDRPRDTLARVAAERWGAQVTCVSTAAEGLSLEAVESHDAYVVGAVLPDMAGVDFLARMGGRCGRTSVVIGDGGSAGCVIELMRVGVADVLAEPVAVEGFEASMERVLRSKARRRCKVRRAARQRRIVRRALAERRELTRRIELVCRDVVAAHRRLFLRVVSMEPNGFGRL